MAGLRDLEKEWEHNTVFQEGVTGWVVVIEFGIEVTKVQMEEKDRA